MEDARQNSSLARVVEEGIATSGRDGRRAAAAFMTSRGVQFAVIVRVLAPDGRRR